MDTNTEPQINSFAGGLNSDDDLSVVATNQYIDARNIRYRHISGEGRDMDMDHNASIGCKTSWIICWQGNKLCYWFNKRLWVVVCIDENENKLKVYSLKMRQAEHS